MWAEKELLSKGSKQVDLWGGGVDTVTREIDFDSLINVRPGVNASHVLMDTELRKKFEVIVRRIFGLE